MKTFKFLYIAATALLFAACTNENEGNENPVAATIHAGISQKVNTRTTVNNTWIAGEDAIGVYVISGGNTTGDNVKYNAADETGTFTSETPIYFKDNQEVTFSAYYPYNDILEDFKMNVQMELVEEKQACKADVLFASGATASKSSPIVRFEQGDTDNRFKHCMSLIEFKIKPGQGVRYNNYKLNYLNMKGIFITGKFDTKTGQVEPNGDRTTKDHVFNNILFESEESFAYIMLPQSLESNKMDVEIYLQLNDNDVKYITSITPSTNEKFEGGKKYTYNITVKNTGILIEEANIMPWMDGTSSNLDADKE